jgi:aspartate racemase
MASVGAELELTMVHADAPTLLGNQQAGNTRAQVEIYERLTRRLHAAGAGCVGVTSVAGHFCIDAFAQVSVLSVIDLRSAVSAAVSACGTPVSACSGPGA